MAPEVLRDNPYTPASDIYSFSMIMWEIISCVPPFDDRAHDFQLSLSICKGERPKIPEIAKNIPKCYINLMKKCWDSDPLKRPTASEVKGIINNWFMHIGSYYKNRYKININYENIRENIDEIIEELLYWDEQLGNDIKEFWEADEALAQEPDSTLTTTALETSRNDPSRQSHPQAYHTSRLL